MRATSKSIYFISISRIKKLKWLFKQDDNPKPKIFIGNLHLYSINIFFKISMKELKSFPFLLVQFPVFLDRALSLSPSVLLRKKALHLMLSLQVHPSIIPVNSLLLPSSCPFTLAFICIAGSFCCRELEAAGNQHEDGSAETEIALGFVFSSDFFH